MNRWTILVVLILAIAVVGGAGYLGLARARQNTPALKTAPPTLPVSRGDVQQMVSAPGLLVAARERILSPSIGGRVARISVHPGDPVHAGDALALLDDVDLQSALRVAQANLTGAQSAYDAAVAKNAHSTDQITVAKTQLEKTTIALRTAQGAYDQVAWRGDIGMLPQSAALQQATIDYQSALANYNLTLTGINDSSVKAAGQALVQAQEALDQAKRRLVQTAITAPFDAIVLEVKVIEGENVNAGAALFRISDPGALEARVTVVEEDYPSVRVGQGVELYFDARPEIMVQGHVTQIVPLRDPGSNPIYPIYVALDQVPAGLAPGMTVDASVLIAKRSNVLRLPRSLAKARDDGRAVVKVWDGSSAEDRVVKVGLRGNQNVEVLEGLREGDLVVSR